MRVVFTLLLSLALICSFAWAQQEGIAEFYLHENKCGTPNTVPDFIYLDLNSGSCTQSSDFNNTCTTEPTGTVSFKAYCSTTPVNLKYKPPYDNTRWAGGIYFDDETCSRVSAQVPFAYFLNVQTKDQNCALVDEVGWIKTTCSDTSLEISTCGNGNSCSTNCTSIMTVPLGQCSPVSYKDPVTNNVIPTYFYGICTPGSTKQNRLTGASSTVSLSIAALFLSFVMLFL